MFLKFGNRHLLKSLTHICSGAIRATRQLTQTFEKSYNLQWQNNTRSLASSPRGGFLHTHTSVHMIVRPQKESYGGQEQGYNNH